MKKSKLSSSTVGSFNPGVDEVMKKSLALARSQLDSYKTLPKSSTKEATGVEGSSHTIETVTGKFLDVLDPNPYSIEIDDIAWAISRISRFAGHTITAIPYVVGQHCLFVADMMEAAGHSNNEVMFGLLHDAAEAYIGDIPSPVKHIPAIHSAIEEIEDNLLREIFNKFVGCQPTDEVWNTVKKFDKRAQFIEANAFMTSRGRHWAGRENYDISLVEMQSFTQPKESIKVYAEFISRFNKLAAKVYNK